MRKNFIIATHGNFGKELLKSSEMILGKVQNCEAYGLDPHTSLEELAEMISADLKEDEEYICLVDIVGGTPFNTALFLTRQYNVRVVTGLSLPMFLEMYLSTDEDISSIIEKGIEAAKVSTKEARIERG